MSKTTNNGGLTLKFTLQFSEIEEVRRTTEREVIIILKSKDRITLRGDEAKSTFSILRRNFPGEHLD